MPRWIIVLLAVLGVGLAYGLGSMFQAQERRLAHLERQRVHDVHREQHNVELLERHVKTLRDEIEAMQARVREAEASPTPASRVEHWVHRGAPEGAGPESWGPAEDEWLRQVARDRTRRMQDRARAASGQLVRHTPRVLDDLLALSDPTDVAVALAAWAGSTDRAAARRYVAENASAQRALVPWLRDPGQADRSTALWLLWPAEEAWAADAVDAARGILEEPTGNVVQSGLRTEVARLLAKRGDVAGEPLLALWASKEPDPRSRGWILFHLVFLHEALRPAGTSTVSDDAIGSLLDGALSLADARRSTDETYVVPVMALTALRTWPRWLDGRRDTVRAMASGDESGLQSGGAREALLKAGDAWALERLAGWIPRLGSGEILLELDAHAAPAQLDALIVGALGPARQAPGAGRSSWAWPGTFKLLDRLRARAGSWVGFPASLRDKPGVREVFDPTLRFDGDPALLAHLETLKSGVPPELADAWFRWLATREGIPVEELEEASTLRRAIDTSSIESYLASASRLLACPAAKRAPHLFAVERAVFEATRVAAK